MFKLWSIKRLLQLWSLITIASIILVAGIAIYSNGVTTYNQSVLTKQVLQIQQASQKMTVLVSQLMLRQKQVMASKSLAELKKIQGRDQLEQTVLAQSKYMKSMISQRYQAIIDALDKELQQFFAIDTQIYNLVSQQQKTADYLHQQIARMTEIEQAIARNTEAITGRIHLQVVLQKKFIPDRTYPDYTDKQFAAIIQLSQSIQLRSQTIRYLTHLLLYADDKDHLLNIRENQLKQNETVLKQDIEKLKNKLKEDKKLHQIATQLALLEQQLMQEVMLNQDSIYNLKQQQIINQTRLLSEQDRANHILNRIMLNLEQIVNFAGTESKKLTQYAIGLAEDTKWIMIALSLFIILGMLRFVLSISQRVNEPLAELRHAMHVVSKGQFDLRLSEKEGNSEFAILSTDFNLFAENTARLIDDLATTKEAVQRREQHIKAILNGVPEVILTINAEGVIESTNNAAEEILKASQEQLIGMNIEQFLAAKYKPFTMYDLEQLSKTNKEMNGVDYQGNTFAMWFTLNRIDAIHTQQLWVGIISDITVWQQMQRELQATSLEMQTILENAMVGIAFVKDRVMQRVNKKLADLFGYTREELEGQPTRLVLIDNTIYQQINEESHVLLAQGGTYTSEVKLARKDGSHFWALLSGQLVDKNHPEAGSIWLCEDVTLQRENDKKLKLLATTDVLTGLPNRALFNDRLEHALYKAHRNAMRIAVLFIDLDNFKHINDSLGHGAGDRLLKEVAQRLTDCVRAEDTVARLGGDEFIILLEEVRSAQHVAKVAEKILDSIAANYQLQGMVVSVSPSIGISLYPADGRDVETLIRNADAAMYHAKHSGKNNFQFYSAEMHQQASQRLALETALRHAVDNDEFYLHFQPQIRLETGAISGVEVLLRWHNEQWENISPAEFVPVLEDTGLIHPVGEIVIRQAIESYLSLREKVDTDFKIAINLSGRQFQGGGLTMFIEQELNKNGVAAHNLELEITESILMEDTELAIKTLNDLSGLGLTLAVDDFGTGYSSLSYLKRFPLDILKIDRSFIRDITIDKDDAAIVDAILAVSRRLNLKVVAEGVENKEQLAFLQAKGCDFVQGYYFSRPLSLSELIHFVSGHG